MGMSAMKGPRADPASLVCTLSCWISVFRVELLEPVLLACDQYTFSVVLVKNFWLGEVNPVMWTPAV